MKARSFSVDSPDDVAGALEEAVADGFSPTVAFTFVSNEWDRSALCEPFSSRGIDVFGATTYGEFVEGAFTLGSASVLLTDLSPDDYQIIGRELTPESEMDVAAEMARDAARSFENPVFLILVSHVETAVEDVVLGIESVVGEEAGIFGAVAAMKSDTTDNFVFTSDAAMSRGILMMVLDGNSVSVSGVATCGWKPVGPLKTVTRSDGMWVHEIDGEPALDLMLKYSGVCTREELTPEIFFDEFAMTLPPQLIREEGDPVMRPSIVYDDDTNSVMCNGRVPEGSKIRFSLPPEDDVIDAVIDACRAMKEERAPEADAILYFSCVGRRLSMGPLMKREINSVRRMWNAPLAGFFSLGEIARVTGGRNELNNLTSCCVVLKEI